MNVDDNVVAPEPEAPWKKWSVAITAALMNCIQAGSFFMTPTTLMPLIVRDFNLPFSLSTAPIALGKLCYVFLLLPGGLLVDSKYGPRRSVITGLALLSLITLMYSVTVTSYAGILVIHMTMAAAASISGVPVYSVFLAQWFDDGLGVATGLVLSGYSLGGMVFPCILGPIAEKFGWRAAMALVSAVLGMVAVPIAWVFLEERNVDSDEEEEDGEDGVDERKQKSIEQADEFASETTALLRSASGFSITRSKSPLSSKDESVSYTGAFIGFACSYILLQYSFGTYAENLLFYLTADCSMDISLATLFLSSLNMAAFVAKLVGGHLGDRFDRMSVASISCIVTAIGVMFLFMPHGFPTSRIPKLSASPTHILLFTLIFGFGYGACFNCLYALVPIVFGKSHLGRIQSALFGFGLAANALGSVLSGVLRSHYGSYDRAFLIGLLCCACNACTFNLTRYCLGDATMVMSAEERKLGEEEVSTMQNTTTYPDSQVQAGWSLRSTPPVSPKITPADSFHSLPTPPQTPPLKPYGHLARSPTYYGGVAASPPPYAISDFNLSPRLPSSFSLHRMPGTSGMSGAPLPIPRDWSYRSLPRMRQQQQQQQQHPTQSPRLGNGRPRRRPRRSRTMESLVDSGVLSASLEFVGYLGQTADATLSPRRKVPEVDAGEENVGEESQDQQLRASSSKGQRKQGDIEEGR